MPSSLVAALREARATLESAAPGEPVEVAMARRLTRELDRAIDRLEGRDADRDLVAVVCHDLKDPLSSIVMGAGFLRRAIPADDGTTRRVVDAVARSADRMGNVIADFHDLARLESGTLRVELNAADLAVIVREALDPLATPAAEKGVALSLHDPGGPVLAFCDRTRIAQIVAKVVGNAIKFTAAGGRVDVTLARAERSVRLTVADTGRGIVPSRIGSVFDHGANARQVPRDGPGLGLPIARGLAELQRGAIAIESEEGKGTVVTVTLPRGQGPAVL